MSPFVVEDPNCEANPFKTYEERDDFLFVLYHGTSSMFRDEIERLGFCFHNFKRKYGKAVCAVVDACKTLYFRPDGFATASLITVNNKTVWFTPHFRIARHYASNTGSECINGALRAAYEFLAFVRDTSRVKRQVEYWENVLKLKGRRHAETQQVLDNLRNSQLVEELTDKVDTVHSFLKDKTSSGFPVVYATLADFSTLEKATLAELRRRQREDGTGIADRRSSDVILKEIVGRADFPNGVTGPFQKPL